MFYNVVVQILVRCLLVSCSSIAYDNVYSELLCYNDQLDHPVICENNIIVIKNVFYSADVAQGEIHKNVRLYTSKNRRKMCIKQYNDNEVASLIAFKEIYTLQEGVVRDYASVSPKPELNQMNDVNFQPWFAKQIFTYNVINADYSNCLASINPRIEFSEIFTKFLGVRDKDEVLPFEHFKKQQENLRSFVFEIERHKDKITDGCYFKFIFEKQVDYGQRYRLSPVFYYKDGLLYLAKSNDKFELTKYPNIEDMTEKDVLNSSALFFGRSLKAKTTERSVSRMRIKSNGLVEGIERVVSEEIRREYPNYVVYTQEIQEFNERIRSEYAGMQVPANQLLERSAIRYNEVLEGTNAPVPAVIEQQPAAAALPAARAAHARHAIPGEQPLQPAHVSSTQSEPQEPQVQAGESEFARDFRREYENAQRAREEVERSPQLYQSEEEWETYRPELFETRRQIPYNIQETHGSIQETLRNIPEHKSETESESTVIESSTIEEKPKLSKRIVFGLIFAGVALVALLIIGIFIGRRAKRRRESAKAI